MLSRDARARMRCTPSRSPALWTRSREVASATARAALRVRRCACGVARAALRVRSDECGVARLRGRLRPGVVCVEREDDTLRHFGGEEELAVGERRAEARGHAADARLVQRHHVHVAESRGGRKSAKGGV
eukprot:6191411-Pleurochrysis_carterae.AAC.3